MSFAILQSCLEYLESLLEGTDQRRPGSLGVPRRKFLKESRISHNPTASHTAVLKQPQHLRPLKENRL